MTKIVLAVLIGAAAGAAADATDPTARAQTLNAIDRTPGRRRSSDAR